MERQMVDYVGLGIQKKIAIMKNLEILQGSGEKSLKKVASVVADKVDFYAMCLDSWDKRDVTEEFSLEEIETGKKCCNAAFDIVESILRDLLKQLPT